jgi:hypothetical protein
MDEITLLSMSGLVSLSSELAEELAINASRAQVLRTPTEMRVSVLNDIKHPTPDSKYWQAVREQDVQFTELVILSFEYRRQMILVERIKRELQEVCDDLDRADAEIRLEEAQFTIARQLRIAMHRKNEILEWSRIKAELIPRCQYSLEEVNEHQMAAFGIRFPKEASMLNGNEGVADRINLVGLAETVKRQSRSKVGI